MSVSCIVYLGPFNSNTTTLEDSAPDTYRGASGERKMTLQLVAYIDNSSRVLTFRRLPIHIILEKGGWIEGQQESLLCLLCQLHERWVWVLHYDEDTVHRFLLRLFHSIRFEIERTTDTNTVRVRAVYTGEPTTFLRQQEDRGYFPFAERLRRCADPVGSLSIDERLCLASTPFVSVCSDHSYNSAQVLTAGQ